MVKTRQPILKLPFVAPVPVGLEVMTFAQLARNAPPGTLERPLRPTFHSIYIVDQGYLTLLVDFEEHRLYQGCALWTKPGQVQLLGPQRPPGRLLLFEAETLIDDTRAAALAGQPGVSHAADVTRASPGRLWRTLALEYSEIARDQDVSAASTEVLRHLLSAFVLSFRSTEESDGLTVHFRKLLERDFAAAHDVDHYARHLGYSTRTLARATQAATGQTPKALISERIMLEARRLLVHTNRPVAAIGRDLGFADPSHFSSAFARLTGESPSGFRRRLRRR